MLLSISFRMHCTLTKHQEEHDEAEENEEVQMNERARERP